MIYEAHRSPVFCVFRTFSRIMCLDSFLEICRPPGIEGAVTTFYYVCILHLCSFPGFCIPFGRTGSGFSLSYQPDTSGILPVYCFAFHCNTNPAVFFTGFYTPFILCGTFPGVTDLFMETFFPGVSCFSRPLCPGSSLMLPDIPSG